jgi:hypothetical protein
MVTLPQTGLICGCQKIGQPNKIRINHERYLKHTMTDLNDLNEPFTASTNSFEMQGMNTFFGNFMTEISPFTDPRKQSELMTCSQSLALPNVPNTSDEAQIWSLYFNGSKSKEEPVQDVYSSTPQVIRLSLLVD